jgi:apolipoprotein N-acyltransferase
VDHVTRLRAWLERNPTLAAFLAGLGVASSLPPVYVLPGVLGFGLIVALLWQCGPGAAFRRGTAFGYGYFLAGLYWVGIAFFADAERFGIYAVPAVLMLALILAVTVGLGAAVVALRRWRRIEAQALAFAVAWVVAEQVRGGWVLQFPWNPVALVWAISDATLQVVAYVGTYGLSLLTVAAAGLTAPLFLARPGSRRAAVAAPLLLAAIALGAGLWRLQAAPPLPDTDVRLRIVQANISQHHKWDPQLRAAWFRHHLELSRTPHDPPAQVVVWPESAVPYDVEVEPEVRSILAEVTPPGGVMLVGGDRYELDRRPQVAHNSLFVLDDSGLLWARYDKVDLVPFGEFLPFRRVFKRLGLRKLTEGAIDFSPGPGRVTLQLPNLPPASPLICYEAAFPGEATGTGERPAWLVNITNDAWFGRSSGPFQHLVMARMRAIEEGLPLVRAANTGISAVTDGYGRIRARLGIDETGVIDAMLPAPLPEASFARRYRLGVLLALLLAVAASSVMVEWRGGDARPQRAA